MNILDKYEKFNSIAKTDEEIQLIIDATNYIQELVEPYGWVLHGSGNGCSFEDEDGNYFSFSPEAWKQVRKVLEQPFPDGPYISDEY